MGEEWGEGIRPMLCRSMVEIILFGSGVCIIRSCVSDQTESITCSFEEGWMCGYSTHDQSRLQWQLGQDDMDGGKDGMDGVRITWME